MTVEHRRTTNGKINTVCVSCPFCHEGIAVQESLAKHLRHECEVNNE